MYDKLPNDGENIYEPTLAQPSQDTMPGDDELTIIDATRDMLAGLEQTVMEGSRLKPEEYTDAYVADGNPTALDDLQKAIGCMKQAMVTSSAAISLGGRPSSQEYIADRESPYNKALSGLLTFLDECCDRWGYTVERTYSAAEAAKDAHSRVFDALLEHLGHYFGLFANVQIDEAVHNETMIIKGTLPIASRTQRPNTVAEIVRIGFEHNDGTLMRPAYVYVYVPALEHAAKFIPDMQPGIVR